MSRPVLLPDTFDGTNNASWEEWLCHFNNVAAVNLWEDEEKIKWLKVRLTGKAQTAFQRLPVESQRTFEFATQALKERFEPTCRKHRYQAELQTRRKLKGENWADFADDLKFLTDKSYPELEDLARDRIALTIYLSNLDNPQVAFGVKQRNPSTLDAAVSATLELESYLTPKQNTLSVMAVEEEQKPKDSTVVGAVHKMEKLCGLVKELALRLERLESYDANQWERSRVSQLTPDVRRERETNFRGGARHRRGGDDVCWNCGKSGHCARNCHQITNWRHNKPTSQQGN